MLIDSHCHLDYDYAPKSTEDLIREAQDAGVVALVTIGTDPASLDKVLKISEKYENVFHTVGFHPHEAVTIQDKDLVALEAAARHPKCRAVGEIGLDYHYDHSPRDVQIKQLELQLEIARKVNQPVVIHSREAEDDLLARLTDYAQKLPKGAIPGIIHCFSGTKAFGEACLKLGFYISFSGILTFKKAEDLRECAAAFPLDRILVETDSPYLAPMPHRGKKCEPSMVRLTAQKLAEVKGLTLDEVSRVTTENARRVFRISL
jgi:TatD DNase family protein